MTKPERGQVWEDCDKRMGGRRLYLVEVDEDYAYGVPLTADGVPMIRTGRRTRLLVRRMKPTSTGWRFVEPTR